MIRVTTSFGKNRFNMRKMIFVCGYVGEISQNTPHGLFNASIIILYADICDLPNLLPQETTLNLAGCSRMSRCFGSKDMSRFTISISPSA